MKDDIDLDKPVGFSDTTCYRCGTHFNWYDCVCPECGTPAGWGEEDDKRIKDLVKRLRK